MSRVQLSINVSDFDAAVTFYSRLFGATPSKLRPGYANFAIDEPPLKLVLNSPGNGPGGTINHLGVEVGTTGEVTAAAPSRQGGEPYPRPPLAQAPEARRPSRGRPCVPGQAPRCRHGRGWFSCQEAVHGFSRCACVLGGVLLADRLADEDDHALVNKSLQSVACSLPQR